MNVSGDHSPSRPLSIRCPLQLLRAATFSLSAGTQSAHNPQTQTMPCKSWNVAQILSESFKALRLSAGPPPYQPCSFFHASWTEDRGADSAGGADQVLRHVMGYPSREAPRTYDFLVFYLPQMFKLQTPALRCSVRKPRAVGRIFL